MGNINSCWAPQARTPVSTTTTSSVCTTKATTAAHNFVVKNYSLIKRMGADKYVASSRFRVGGYNWCIDFCPGGDARAPGYAAAFLRRCGGAAAMDVMVRYRLSMREEGGKVHKVGPLWSTTFRSRLGSTLYVNIGSLRIANKSKLRGDCFIITCDLIVIGTPTVQDCVLL
ncbi:hypothetical protein ZWY2020_012937 [Hordeum vulgare]|nr:hypothetical protein ZWY2020_012937 [Hordeum vulgare]